MERLIERVVLPHHPRLGRNVNRDSQSRAYRVSPTRTARLSSTRHEAFIPILDQDSVGACTGDAGTSAIYHEPYMTAQLRPWLYPPNQDGALALYSEATNIDPFPGEYPPTDTGSDGLSIAKVLKARGVISGYLWAFTLAEALAQLQDTPVITGLPWLNSMFDTTSDGHPGHVQVRQDSGLAGGHEICADELIVPGGGLGASEVPGRLSDIWVGGPNSWGTSWGDGGRWYMTAAEWGWLLSQQGDVTAFVASTEPAPEPAVPPVVDETAAGDELWASVRKWAASPHMFSNNRAAANVRKWAKRTGRL